MKQIIITSTEYEIKAALLEDGVLTEFFIERDDKKRIVGNIYKGKVANVLPGMESAFVDIGLKKNSFLYVKDLREFEEKYLDGIEHSKKPIEEILNVNDNVIVQILKEPTGTKGARVTTHYTIPGKYLVLMPNNDYIAISKKIGNEEERERLKNILQDIKPDGVGVIIRTDAQGKDEKYFIKEIEYLTKQWKEVEHKSYNAQIGDLIYKDSTLVERVLRDIFSSEIDHLVVDSEDNYWKVIDYISTFSDSNLKLKVQLYHESEPIFEHYGINSELKKVLQKKVWLDCGGYLIIEKTEALVSIDVNTGKNTGTYDLESTVFQTNMEAAKEIPKQLRLRNLGGIIIIDFIDMKLEEDQKKVVEILEENLSKDRIKNNIVRFTELGLVEMTRKRTGKELSKYFLEKCPHCNGTGMIKSSEFIIDDIIMEIRFLSVDEDIKRIKLKVSNQLYAKVQSLYLDFIEKYLKDYNKEFEVLLDRSLERDKYEIVLEN
ncbi:Rne/Rng family ribonuclease [Haliovirga abyssi]|uniref:Ribonuclease G n=1 Tax=Haliovirga abyssi TaxID=2996794 RepID=A0AAU9DDI3_9FUSO|nr:Rne/Rng family ribonuclease [Haliovirga abyssi]BDU50387.1 ribonuclease G [Haliovirga abyssi]